MRGKAVGPSGLRPAPFDLPSGPGPSSARSMVGDSSRAPPPWVALMWKSVFLATGLFACLVGAELLIVDSATVKPVRGSGPASEVTAPDWAPWALISAGAVTLLHFCTGVGSGSGHGPTPPKPQAGKFPQF